MDFKRLMEEAKANQEKKAKRLAMMRESQKQNEIEKQRKEREKRLQAQAQAQIWKVNRIKHATNHTSKDGRKQSELQVKHKKKPIEENTKVPKLDTHKQIKEKQHPHPQQNSTQPKPKPKPTITTQKVSNENKSIQNNKIIEKNKSISKPVSGEKKSAPNFKELMEMAQKNLEKSKPKGTTDNPSQNLVNRTPHNPQLNTSAEKRKTPEEYSKSTDPSKKLKLKESGSTVNKKKSKEPAKQEPPKPRPQIQQSEYFRKTFDTSTNKKPTNPSSRQGPGMATSSRQDEDYSEDDDFIVSDDEDDSKFDVSAFIQNMFRYNKSKYADDDNETADRVMESNYSQQQFEERRSARIGLMEDLEDMKREDEEIIKKFAIKKKKTKKLKRL